MLDTPHIIYFIEGKRYSRAELEGSLENPVDSLLNRSHLERLPDGSHVFRFVGVLAFRKEVICVLPKIYDGLENAHQHFPAIVKTLKKYAVSDLASFDESTFLESDLESPEVSALSLADFILSDYVQHGTYKINYQYFELSSDAGADWPMTVAEITPFFSQGRPIYPQVYRSFTDSDNRSIISEIHKWAVNYCRETFGSILGFDEVIIYENVVGQLGDLGDTDSLVFALRSALSSTFVDRETLLLKCLIALLESPLLEGFNLFSAFGTRNYELVWEAICKDYFRHEDIHNNNKTLIMPPVWHLFGTGIRGKATTIPDVVHFESAYNTLFLFDAKYYNLSIDLTRKTLSGEPNIKDIFKQFLYEQILEAELKCEVINAFLFPIDEEKLKVYAGEGAGTIPYTLGGRVEYVLFQDRYISVLFLPLSRFSEKYYKNIKASPAEFELLRENLRK